MIRVILNRSILDEYTGLRTENYETLDIVCHELEKLLDRGELGTNYYDKTDAVGMFVLDSQE